MEEPVGYAFSEVVLSWKVTDTKAKKQMKSEILISEEPRMERMIAEKSGRLHSNAETVEISLAPRKEYYVQVRVTGDNGESAVSETARFETGKREEAWTAKWIGTEEEDSFHPVFEKTFCVPKPVKRARLYICGLGVYEAYLDGQKIGEDILAPFYDDYTYGIQSQTYAVELTENPEHRLSVAVGNGWYKGRLGYDGAREVYGDRFACIAELHLEYEDGTCGMVETDHSWEYYQSDIESSDIYDGEILNRLHSGKQERKGAVILEKMKDQKLTDRYSLPLKEMEKMPVREVLHTPAGETVLDFGQNFAGYVRFFAAFPSGTRVRLQAGEILQNGNFYRENYRSAKAEFTYISDGRREWVQPHFTYMGFRYMLVTGWPYEVKKDDFMGLAVYSAMERTGYLETGHQKVNQLISNSLWGLKSNFLDMPTDCPQRDERLGWTGDAQVFAPAASFFMDTRAFYRKYLRGLRNDQEAHGGAVADFLPNYEKKIGGASVWGDAAVLIPDTLYETFGDKAALAENYPMMKDWVEWIRAGDERREGGPKYVFDFGFAFGDWLAMDGVTEQSFKGGTEDDYIASVYWYASVRKLAKAAEILEKAEDARRYNLLADKIHKAVLFEYFAPSGRLAVDTQTGYIIALYFGIYCDKEAVKRGLRQRLKRDGYRIKCGFVGAPLFCETLADNGMEDLAFHLFLQEDFPGWLHCVNLGATTIWERWNSVLDDGSISGTGMNSLNHYAYGSVMHYVQKCIAGLEPMTAGYRKVKIKPQFDARLKYMNCTYHSASGTYTANWRILQTGEIQVHYEIPFDCEAIVVLPGYKETLRLDAGVTELVYHPERNYRKLLGWNSLLGDCRMYPQAMEILKNMLPAGYEMASGNDLESLGLTFQELRNMPWFGFSPQELEEAAKELFELEAAPDI